jgi:hypothetical protein
LTHVHIVKSHQLSSSHHLKNIISDIKKKKKMKVEKNENEGRKSDWGCSFAIWLGLGRVESLHLAIKNGLTTPFC